MRVFTFDCLTVTSFNVTAPTYEIARDKLTAMMDGSVTVIVDQDGGELAIIAEISGADEIGPVLAQVDGVD